MNRITRTKLNRYMRRTFTLLLAVLMLSNNAFATSSGFVPLDGNLSILIDPSAFSGDREKVNYYEKLYGEDWEEVMALQPGDSYVGAEYMYVCYEESRVEWSRVKSKDDLNGENWEEDRLLLLTSGDGNKLYLGNDYVNRLEKGSYKSGKSLNASAPDDVWFETDKDSGEQVERYTYPELQDYAAKSTGDYPYPDKFETVGTMNAPYIRYMGADGKNDNHPKFKIILSKDNGEISAVSLGLNSGSDNLELEAAKKSESFTFRMTSFLDIFAEVNNADDVRLAEKDGQLTASKTVPKSESYIAYVGKKHSAKRIVMYSLDPDAAQDPDNLENVYGGSIEFYKWTRITDDGRSELGNGVNNGFNEKREMITNYQPGCRMLLVWEDKYFLSGDDFRLKDDGNGMALYVNEGDESAVVAGNIADHPEIQPRHLDDGTSYNQNFEEFYTADGMGTPYLYHQWNDDDVDNDYCWYFAVQLAGADDRPSGKWLCDADNKLGICTEEPGQNFKAYGGKEGIGEEARVGFILGDGWTAGNDAEHKYVKMFFKDSGSKYDTGFYHDGNVLYGADDWSGWDYSQFKLFIGSKVTFPAVRQDYIVGEDQFMHISQNGAMLQDVTITVQKGGVLSIESWFMNNGRIIVDGGTLIVQAGKNPLGSEKADDTGNSVLMPYLDINPAVSGSLDLRNGGELILLKDARAAFKSIKALTGSSIFNNGMLLAETITLKDSTLENRPGMTILTGYDVQTMHEFRMGTVNQVINDLTTKLQAGVPCIYQGKNSSIQNDGVILYSTTINRVEDGSDLQLGSGEYNNHRGKEVKYIGQ